MTKEKFEMIANELIDERCDGIGVIPTIVFLLDLGLTRADLVELKFDEEDIEEAMGCNATDIY